MSERLHGVARCRWCGEPFKLIYDFQWICRSPACADRQTSEAVLKLDTCEVPWPSPFIFLPLPLQVEIEEAPVKRLLVHGRSGISKSYGGRWHLIKRCRKIPGYAALLLRCTYDQLEKNHLQFLDMESRLLGDAKYEKGTPKRLTLSNDSTIRFGYCQDRADIPQHTGPEWDEVVIEEAVQMLPDAIAEIMSRDRGAPTSRAYRIPHDIRSGRTRLLTNPGGRAALFLREFFIDKNPDKSEFEKYNPKWYGAMTGDFRDNPYLDEDFEDANLGGLSKDRWEQLARGNWDVFPGQFFEAWNPSVHVVDMEAI